ncbi:1-phosphofructokinase family hexose kinase [Myxococcaceae bacterium GXIMD 01537]
MPRIVTLTLNPALDVSTSTAEVTPEHKLRCDEARFDPGGGGLNVARVVRELGGESLAVYPRGGPTGDLLEQLLEARGVTRRPIAISGFTRESFTVAETRSGREFRFVLPGPAMTQPEWQGCLDTLVEAAEGASFLVASGSLVPGVPVDFYARVARLAKKLGVRCVVDTSGEPLKAALAEGVFLAKPNRREFRALSGVASDEVAALAPAARALVERGEAQVLVVSMGAEGALLTLRGTQLRAVPPPVATNSSVGAGDSFVAGMTYAMARGIEAADAFRWGVAAGTAALLTAGTELCRRGDTERLLAQVRPEPVAP